MVQIDKLPRYRNKFGNNDWMEMDIETHTTLHYNGIETEKIFDLVILYADIVCNGRLLMRMVWNE
jgi:hypothetical protein